MLVMAHIQGIVIKICQLEKSCTLTQGCQSMCNGLIVHRTLDSNFDAFLYLEWQSNRYHNSFVRHEGFQSSTRDMPAGYQRCWRTWGVDKLAGNRGNKVQGDFYKILFSTAWCIRLKWLVVSVSLSSHPKLLDQQFTIFTCSWSRWKWTLIFTFLFTFQIGALKILKEISRNCIIRKAIADLGGEEGPRASWSFQGEIVSHVAVICLVMHLFYVREACSVTAPVRLCKKLQTRLL